MLTIFILNYIYYSSLSAYKINVIFHNKNSQRKDVSWYINLNWHIKSLYFLREADLQYDRVKEKKKIFRYLLQRLIVVVVFIVQPVIFGLYGL